MKTIMFIEDDPLLREVIAMAFEGSDVRLMLAESGEDALRQLRAERPHPTLILLDMRMPVMDGREFRAAQLADPDVAAIPIILLSAHADVPEAARDMGATAWLKKPLDLRVLRQIVEEHA